MSSEGESFSASGPNHLTVIDWESTHYRSSVIASLVQGVYVLERDRQQNRVKTLKALAPPWWEFFNFQLNDVLVDPVDHSFFGAVFELKSPALIKAPKYVVAFRGTLTEPNTRSRDILLDLKCISNRLHKNSRFKCAFDSIKTMVDSAGTANVWLGGHSLGSAIALHAGKKMTKRGYPLETYLFNCPFVSATLERIWYKKIKHGIHFSSSVIKVAAIGTYNYLQKHKKQEEDDQFEVLANWVPHLFVNPADPICSGYIDYFSHREMMEIIGASEIERLATKHTGVSLMSAAILGRKSEPYHLLPSAELIINHGQSSSFSKAHGIAQWWDPELNFRIIMYKGNKTFVGNSNDFSHAILL
ncbi:GDSL esterase/lipase [Quillaja saponaria]|uniref:GDSL esterase/lipase n=1 Tax=Quillaja saponaria TaxID=32244 RepID=A0AAD7LK40_QUISA|nr:GDSL esterase/lipase [Quillaja saponaria]